MNTLVKRQYTDEELGESVHYRRSLQYLHSLLGNTYYRNKPLASFTISNTLGCFKQNQIMKRKSLKERFEDALVNLNVFQMSYDALKFLSSSTRISSLNPLQEWRERRRKRRENAALGIIDNKERVQETLQTNQPNHCGPFRTHPSGMTDFHTQPVFQSVKQILRIQKRLDTTPKYVPEPYVNQVCLCKSCPPAPSAGLSGSDSLYENYKITVTYARIPKEHKKKTEDRFRALYTAAAISDSPQEPIKKRQSTIDASNFAIFVHSAHSAPSTARRPMSASAESPAKMYGPDAIALVSGPEFRRRETKRSLPKHNANVQTKGKSSSVVNIDNLGVQSVADEEDKRSHESLIPIPSSSFRFLDDEYKLKNANPIQYGMTQVADISSTPGRSVIVKGSGSIPYVPSRPGSAKSNAIRTLKDDAPHPKQDKTVRSRASVPQPHVPGAHGDTPNTTTKSSRDAFKNKPIEFVVGGSPRQTSSKQVSKSTRGLSFSGKSLKDEALIKLSAKIKQPAPPPSPRIQEASKGSSANRKSGKKPKADARKNKKQKIIRRFNQSISTVSVRSPQSKSKPIGMLSSA